MSVTDESEPLLTEGEPQPNYGNPAPPNNKDVHIPSTREVLTPDLRIILLNHGFLTFTDMSYFVLISLIYTSSITTGGLGLSPYQAGLILGIVPLFNGAWNLLVLTRILKKIGPRNMYIICYASFLVTFLLLWILRDVAHAVEKVNALVWVLIVCQFFSATFVLSAYNSISLLAVQSAPPNGLGVANGLVQTVASGMRGLAPWFGPSMFSVSLKSRMLGGHLVDIILIALSAIGLLCALRLPKSSA